MILEKIIRRFLSESASEGGKFKSEIEKAPLSIIKKAAEFANDAPGIAVPIAFRVSVKFSKTDQVPEPEDIFDAVRNASNIGLNSPYSTGDHVYIFSKDLRKAKKKIMYDAIIVSKTGPYIQSVYPDINSKLNSGGSENKIGNSLALQDKELSSTKLQKVLNFLKQVITPNDEPNNIINKDFNDTTLNVVKKNPVNYLEKRKKAEEEAKKEAEEEAKKKAEEEATLDLDGYNLAKKYRLWANSSVELSKKYGKQSIYNLDRIYDKDPGNSYFTKSYKAGKSEFDAFCKNATDETFKTLQDYSGKVVKKNPEEKEEEVKKKAEEEAKKKAEEAKKKAEEEAKKKTEEEAKKPLQSDIKIILKSKGKGPKKNQNYLSKTNATWVKKWASTIKAKRRVFVWGNKVYRTMTGATLLDYDPLMVNHDAIPGASKNPDYPKAIASSLRPSLSSQENVRFDKIKALGLVRGIDWDGKNLWFYCPDKSSIYKWYLAKFTKPKGGKIKTKSSTGGTTDAELTAKNRTGRSYGPK
jgi:hypothetical protein